ncbi:hypothetical protein [Streptomyces sp. NPDC058755]|uniref:hypothetical protein n=1 Tax=Streptomyces sp. NPDC058755 TaxID=3346624 RepID=UPI0036A8988F
MQRSAEAPVEPALAHLLGLVRALVEPLRAPSGSPLVGARAVSAEHSLVTHLV